ncbi:DNA internalization-related competence protein ComEC/Rec2 [Pigmentiphaga soli]|uniref:DNA internalization-related competence protein ComEC/Rec2 n=1 Tax=Pigmentiphaga soli TaxID=1007095 RepID=A0ABP8H790_9BURK
MFRIHLLAFVAGIAAAHLFASVPPWPVTLGALAACAVLAAWARTAGRNAGRAGAALLCLALGAGWTAIRADLRLADALAPQRENRPLALRFQVASLPSADALGQRFEALVLEPPRGVPSRVLLSWYAPPGRVPEMLPGQLWQAQAVLKRPHGNANPDGFDYEALLFERGLRATGTLRGTPRLVGDRPWADADIAVQRIRHGLRRALREPLARARYGAVVVALAMGDQAGVPAEDWAVFSRVGITHLVSISGLHVTMLAALAAAAVLAEWKRWSWRGLALSERTPAQIAAAAAAVAVAGAYCLIAGWGVPARRTFFMLAVVAGAAIARLPWSGSRVLVAAAALVCALDPWAPVAPGFWLSFGAVAMLLTLAEGRWRRPATAGATGWRGRARGLVANLREAARLQLAITIGMTPLTALLFQQVSLVSPLANALAIPLVSLLVTPLALAAMLLCATPGLAPVGGWLARAAHAVFEWMMGPMQALSELPVAAWSTAATPWPLTALALAGVAWALQPRGLPGRFAALALLLPALVWRPPRPAPGDWRLTALDVGQGAAIVVETAHATLVYDTGPRYGAGGDAGARIVWPYLRARGIGRVQTLMVSHGDMDHAGGAASLVAALPVDALTASYDLPASLEAAAGQEAARPWRFVPCMAGQEWMRDGVRFTVLAPSPGRRAAAANSADRNAASCVLKIQGRRHAALLTGDISLAEERQLLRRSRQSGGLRADVAMMPHHGSRHASGADFVAAVHAAHAIAQAGYLNRYHHPHPDAIGRWQAAGTRVHRTDRDGAVVAESAGGALNVVRERERRRRMWQAR